jgi:integrase
VLGIQLGIQELMALSYPTHLIRVNSRYYYKIKVPADLSHLFPCRFIKKSLFTNQLHAAKTMLMSYEYHTHNAFALLRTGTLAPEHIQQVVNSLLPVPKDLDHAKRPEKKSYRIKKVIEIYTAEKQAGWTDKTKMEVAGVFKMVVDILGDVDVSTITRPILIELRSSLLKVPPNFYVKKNHGSIRDAIKKAEGPGLSIKTVNKDMARIGSLLKYCHELGYISNNPATGLQISEKQRADQERNVYTSEDIKRIVGNLPLDAEYPERYWIPLIGLYSGLRLNEICQLHIEDVVNVDGHWCFDINDAGNKRLKNAASARLIPIHPRLIETGFVLYYEAMKAQGQPRLWMNLTHLDLHGYTNSIGKWYARFNREVWQEISTQGAFGCSCAVGLWYSDT